MFFHDSIVNFCAFIHDTIANLFLPAVNIDFLKSEKAIFSRESLKKVEQLRFTG